MSERYVVVIPSRLHSTRLKEKALQPILGRPMLSWVIEGVQKSQLINDIYVATDDSRIAQIAEKSGVRAIMTSPDLPSGTDRIEAALTAEKISADFIFNVQGDEPLMDGTLLDELIESRRKNSQIEMLTLVQRLNREDVENPHIVKVVTDRFSNALYFSRFSLPFSREEFKQSESYQRVFKHIGLYGYSRKLLSDFCLNPPSELEKNESLEQLRALDMGIKIRVYLTERHFQGVDTMDDVFRVEKILDNKMKLD